MAKGFVLIWTSGRRQTSCGGLLADLAQRKCDHTKIAWEGALRQQNYDDFDGYNMNKTTKAHNKIIEICQNVSWRE